MSGSRGVGEYRMWRSRGGVRESMTYKGQEGVCKGQGVGSRGWVLLELGGAI